MGYACGRSSSCLHQKKNDFITESSNFYNNLFVIHKYSNKVTCLRNHSRLPSQGKRREFPERQNWRKKKKKSKGQMKSFCMRASGLEEKDQVAKSFKRACIGLILTCVREEIGSKSIF